MSICTPEVARKNKTKQKTDSVPNKYTTASRWEIRNISIFITATWKTLECLHPVQQATQRQLAWGQISIIRWPDREVKKKKSDLVTEWESPLHNYNTDQVGSGGQWLHLGAVRNYPISTWLACINTNLEFSQSKSERLEFCSILNWEWIIEW